MCDPRAEARAGRTVVHDGAAPMQGSALSSERLEFFDAAAVLFDLDGVITPTAEVHMRAWSTMFTALFADRGVQPPYSDRDYF